MDRKRKARGRGIREDSAACASPKIVALFLVASLQWATVLVVCPSLHELIHHDADDEHHDCAVTLFLAGQVEQPAINPIIITGPALVQVALDQSYDTLSCGSFFLSCRILEHAPPLRS
jgi:hypothetical protein